MNPWPPLHPSDAHQTLFLIYFIDCSAFSLVFSFSFFSQHFTQFCTETLEQTTSSTLCCMNCFVNISIYWRWKTWSVTLLAGLSEADINWYLIFTQPPIVYFTPKVHCMSSIVGPSVWFQWMNGWLLICVLNSRVRCGIRKNDRGQHFIAELHESAKWFKAFNWRVPYRCNY